MEKITESKNLDYVEYIKTVNELISQYKNIKKSVIGKSVMGKDIIALTLGEGSEQIFYSAAYHGSEHITTNIALMFLENLCYCLLTDKPMKDINMKAALKGRSIVIVPRVNPDGCDINILGAAGAGKIDFLVRKLSDGNYKKYNANARGVDINHNFDAGFKELKTIEKAAGIIGPAATRFGGFYPESEPETKAVASYCRKNNVRHAFALHTQGEVIYWNYGKRTPLRSLKMAEIMASVSGYSLDVPVALATGGGFKDYFIEKFRRPAFTLEMGRGKNPLPIETAEDIYNKAEEMLALGAIM